MRDDSTPDGVDHQFFVALLDADVAALDRALADDFVLVDVMSGSEIPKSVLLQAIESGQLRFDAIEPADSHVRLYQTTAVIVGRTQMSGTFGDEAFSASSRYTHVFVEQHGRWRMVAAQGTQIASAPAQP